MPSVEHSQKIIATPDGAGVAGPHQSKHRDTVRGRHFDNIWP